MQCAVGALLTSIPLWYCEQFHCSPTLTQSDTVCFPMPGMGELLPVRKTPSSASDLPGMSCVLLLLVPWKIMFHISVHCVEIQSGRASSNNSTSAVGISV